VGVYFAAYATALEVWGGAVADARLQQSRTVANAEKSLANDEARAAWTRATGEDEAAQ